MPSARSEPFSCCRAAFQGGLSLSRWRFPGSGELLYYAAALVGCGVMALLNATQVAAPFRPVIAGLGVYLIVTGWLLKRGVKYSRLMACIAMAFMGAWGAGRWFLHGYTFARMVMVPLGVLGIWIYASLDLREARRGEVD